MKKTVELKVAKIGNSRGVRLPAGTLERYRIGESVVMEERVEGILLRPHGHLQEKLSWEETARDMAASGEDWTDWDRFAADGLAEIPWERKRRVAESSAEYEPPRRKKRR